MHKHTFSPAALRPLRRLLTAIVIATFLLCQQSAGIDIVIAASTWNPTMLVNTESFQIVDEGDSSTNIEFRFGQSLNEKIFYDRANARFVFSRSLKVNGTLTTTGAAIIGVGATTATPDAGIALEVLGTASGMNLFATKSISGAHLYAATTFGGAGLTDCSNATNSKLLWSSATKQFSCGTDQTGSVTGTFVATGALMGVLDNRYVNTAGDTMTGSLKVRANLSGSALTVDGNAGVYGALTTSGSVATKTNLTINSDSGGTDAVITFGSDGTAETATFKNAEDRFEFSDDVAATGNLTASGTFTVDGNAATKANLTINSDNEAADAVLTFGNNALPEQLTFVQASGLFRFSDDVEIVGNFEVIGTMSGRSLYVTGTASGQNLFAAQSVTGTHLYASTTFNGAGLTNCSTNGTDKLLWNSATKQFSCGTDQTGGGGTGTFVATGALMGVFDNRYVNTSGDTMTGTLTININGTGGNGTGLVLRERAYLGSGATLSGSLVLNKRAIPGKTSAGTLGVFSREVAGRSLLHAIGSNGFEYPVQPGLDRSVFLIAPAATTTVTTHGTTTTNSATLSHPTPTEALPYATNFATSTTSGNESGLISVNTIAFRGSTTGFNGFYYHARVIVIDTTSMIAYSGLTSASSLANVFGGTSDPAGHHAGFQFSTLRSDTNWQFITKDNTTQNVVNTGMAFTANNVYELYMYVEPQGTTVYWRVDNRTAGTSAEGSTTSNLPGSSTALRIATGVETQTTAAKSFRSSRIYLEASR